MIYHVPSLKTLKNSTKLELVGYAVSMGFGLFLVWIIFYLEDRNPQVKHFFNTYGTEAVQASILIVFSLVLGVTLIFSKIYQKYFKTIPCCKGCLNPLRRYSIDLISEKIKCRMCGFESTFYQFPDKLFLHYKFLEMQKNKDNDQILMDKIEELLKKFGNFEFSKKGGENGHSS